MIKLSPIGLAQSFAFFGGWYALCFFTFVKVLAEDQLRPLGHVAQSTDTLIHKEVTAALAKVA